MSQKPRATQAGSSSSAGSPSPGGPADDRVRPGEGIAANEPARAVNRLQGADSIEQVNQVEQAGKAAAAAPVRAAEAAAPVQQARAVESTPRAELVKEIAEKLRRGEMTSSQAVEALIDDAVRSHIAGPSGGGQDDAIGEELRATLHSYVQHDPSLAARVRRLGKNR